MRRLITKKSRRVGDAVVETLLALPCLAMVVLLNLELLRWFQMRSAVRYATFVAGRSATVHYRLSGTKSTANSKGLQAAHLAISDALNQEPPPSFLPPNIGSSTHFKLTGSQSNLLGVNQAVQIEVKHLLINPCRLANRLSKRLLHNQTGVCPASWWVTSELPGVMQGYSHAK